MDRRAPSLQTRETLSVAVSCEMHGELESEGIAVRCELESSSCTIALGAESAVKAGVRGAGVESLETWRAGP